MSLNVFRKNNMHCCGIIDNIISKTLDIIINNLFKKKAFNCAINTFVSVYKVLNDMERKIELTTCCITEM